jgi:hypothetical protein
MRNATTDVVLLGLMMTRARRAPFNWVKVDMPIPAPDGVVRQVFTGTSVSCGGLGTPSESDSRRYQGPLRKDRARANRFRSLAFLTRAKHKDPATILGNSRRQIPIVDRIVAIAHFRRLLTPLHL